MSGFLDEVMGGIFQSDSNSNETSNSNALGLSAISTLNQQNVTNSTTKENPTPAQSVFQVQADKGVREKIDPDTDWSIPVVYGDAWVNGSVTDAYMTEDTLTMWYCVTLCEQTGTKLSDSLESEIRFREVVWNNMRCSFGDDGIRVYKMYDEDNAVTDTYLDYIWIYPFSGSSEKPVAIGNYPAKNERPAYELFPEWTNRHMMTDLVFMLVKVVYNAEKQVTGIGDLKIRLQNSMKQPGDVMYDYMTNTRYGCGLAPEQINAGE